MSSPTLEAPDPTRWREQVHALLRGVLDVMEAHPGIATVAVANPPTSERTLLFADNLMGVLLAGGASVQDAAWGCDILPLITTATAIETATYEQMITGGGDERFRYAIDVFLDGLEARAARPD